MEDDLPCHKIKIENCFGLILPWSNGYVVPFVSNVDICDVNLMVRKITLKGLKAKHQKEKGEPSDEDRRMTAVKLVTACFGCKLGGIISKFLKDLEARECKKEACCLPAKALDLILAYLGFLELPSIVNDNGDNGGDGDDSESSAKRTCVE